MTDEEVAKLLEQLRAKEESAELVDRGQLVYLTVTFAGRPQDVYFSYMRPQEKRAIVDPGYGREGSRIVCLDETRYQYAIDSTGFRGGICIWHFWSTGEHQASKFGQFQVRDSPPQLL